MRSHYVTKRLELDKIALSDASFLRKLVNTADWLRYIGDKNVKTQEDAVEYTRKIIDSPQIEYWVVRLKKEKTAIGIVTFIKRDYLEHHDIGFAFLSDYMNHGYANEASASILDDAIRNQKHKAILATTIKENKSSIKLLEKLGLRFDKEIKNENGLLSVYSVSVDKLQINKLTKDFYSLFANTKQQILDLERIYSLCLPDTLIIKKTSKKEEHFSIKTFIEPRKLILSDGTLTEFEEYEVFEETTVIGSIAQRFSKFYKSGYLNGAHFESKGNKLFQFIKSDSMWKISSVLWEDEET
jgi:RimJ/RimL family protein N-acetyltransferase